MPKSKTADVAKHEVNIAKLKAELSKISEERWRAALARNQDAILNARIRALEKTLENNAVIAQYVGNFSSPIGRDLEAKHKQLSKSFEEVRLSRDPNRLHSWVKTELVPSTKYAESMGHVVASSVRKMQGKDISLHKWASN